ncbi:MAG: DUF4158 domain-containing protein [Legionellales bacterium]|nr:DUF4158 domain-containing protein [Legionellales bacterium]
MDSSLSFDNINDFWNPIPGSFDGLNNKKGMAHFVYLILLHYFYHYRQFPDYENIPKEMILYGIKHISTVSMSIDDVSQAFQNERQLYRYKEEIREHFGYRVFEQTDIDILKRNFSVLFSGNINKETLKESLAREIDKCKFDRPDNAEIETIFNQIQSDEEQLLFHRINSLLAETDKEYIDSYILSSNDCDGVCQFLRQDSSSSTRENVKQEIKRLEILARLPIEQLLFVYDVNIKQRNIYRRRFLTDTPKRSKRRTNDTRYALAMIFICQRYQEAIDNLVDHLLYFIHQMKKAADAKGKKLHAELGKQMGDLDLLYQLAEINRDHPQDIIEQAVYPEIPQETIDQLIKTRELSKSVKKLVQESVIKKYSISFRSSIFNILTCIDLKSNNMEFMKAINLIQRYQHSKVKYYPIEEIIPANDIMSKQQQQYIFEKDESGTVRVIKKDYECAIFKLLRRKLRHKEVWVSGA